MEVNSEALSKIRQSVNFDWTTIEAAVRDIVQQSIATFSKQTLETVDKLGVHDGTFAKVDFRLEELEKAVFYKQTANGKSENLFEKCLSEVLRIRKDQKTIFRDLEEKIRGFENKNSDTVKLLNSKHNHVQGQFDQVQN